MSQVAIDLEPSEVRIGIMALGWLYHFWFGAGLALVWLLPPALAMEGQDSAGEQETV